MSDNKYIYAFLHIPKTAGTTFKYHIVKYLKKEEHLYLGADSLGLWNKKRGTNLKDAKKAVIKKLKNTKNLDRLRIIHGHMVVYGLHNYLPKPVRYFTFVREPVQRTISMYNHYREQYESLGENKEKDNDYNILVDGKIPSFSTWLDKKYNPQNNYKFLTMYQKFILNGFLRENGNIDKEIEKAITKFWFIGIVKNFDEESLYLYKKIGINAFFTNQNISKKYFKLSESPEIVGKIIERNKKDILIYERFKTFHDKNLGKQPNYYDIVRNMRIKKKLILPFTQAYYAPKDAMSMVFNKTLNLFKKALQTNLLDKSIFSEAKDEGKRGIRTMGHRKYVGGKWYKMGKLQFDFLVKNNLKKNHVLLDVGCGSLRAGVFLIPFLNKGNYLGIEKEKKLIEAGINEELGNQLYRKKKPELVISDSFEFGKFTKKPDFVIAQSLFTHLNSIDIQKCMRKLRDFVKENTVFYATFFEAEQNYQNPKRSHDHRAFVYTRTQMKKFGINNGWDFKYIGDWGHPRNQIMVEFRTWLKY